MQSPALLITVAQNTLLRPKTLYRKVLLLWSSMVKSQGIGLKEAAMISDNWITSNGRQRSVTYTIDVLQLSRSFSAGPEK
jgi:hypothetical protein